MNQVWVLAFSKALVPFFCEMNLLEWQSLDLLHRTFDLFVSIAENAGLEKKLFKLNKHSALFERLNLFRFLMDGIESIKEGVLENTANVLVHLVVKQSLVCFNLVQVFLDLFEIALS